MNNNYLKYLFCLAMFHICQPIWVSGQSKPISLEECIAYAKTNNFIFKIQALKNKQAETNFSKQIIRFLPEVNANLNHQYDFGSAIDPNTNSRLSANFQYDNININAQIHLFNFAELWDSKLQKKDIDIEKANSKVVEQEYNITLIEKFYTCLATQEWTSVLRKQIDNTEIQVDRIHKEVNEGLKPESDLYDIQVVYTQEKKQLQVLEQQYVNKLTELFQWINNPNDSKQYTLIKNTSSDTVDENFKIENSNQVLLEIEKSKKLELEHHQLIHNFLPRVSLGYAIGTFYSQQINNIGATSFNFGSQFRNNKSQYVGLGIQIPIFSRGDNSKARHVKKIQLAEQNLHIERVKTEQLNRINNFQNQLSQFKELISTLVQANKFAEQSLQTTLTKYEYGKVDIASFKTAKNQVLSSSYDIVNNDISIHMIQHILNELYH